DEDLARHLAGLAPVGPDDVGQQAGSEEVFRGVPEDTFFHERVPVGRRWGPPGGGVASILCQGRRAVQAGFPAGFRQTARLTAARAGGNLCGRGTNAHHEPATEAAMPWNPSAVGEVSLAQGIAALARMGKPPLLPLGDTRRYDFVVEDEDGRFLRVQCKTGRIVRGAIGFPTSSMHAPSRTGLEKTTRRSYRGQVDLFGVYCPENGKVYLVPGEDVRESLGFLRVDPPKNNQQTHIRWATDYELGTTPRLGSLSELPDKLMLD